VRQYDQAIASELKCLRRAPKHFWAHVILGWAYEQKRMYPEALTELREAVQLTNSLPLTLAAFGEVLAASGDRRGAIEVLSTLKETAKVRYVSAYDVSMIYAALGNKSQAFAWLEKAERDRSSLLPYVTWDRRADSLRADPRYQDLLRRMNLPVDSVTTATAPTPHP
jgi:tetratricopeptide (TPR) repeat protein